MATIKRYTNGAWEEVTFIPDIRDQLGSATTITLAASGWTASNDIYVQSVTIDGIIANTEQQLVSVSPSNNREQVVAACSANIICSSQDTNSLTFSAESIPEIDIQFVVEWKSINYVGS